MRKIFYVLAILFAISFCTGVNAQSVRFGGFTGYTTSNDKSEAVTQDGGDFFPGFTASAAFREGKRVSFHVRGDFARPQLPTLFTTDEGEDRPEYEVRINPEVRLNAGKFFAGVGLDTFYHGGLHNDPGEPYTRSYGINPTASAGLFITPNNEASFTYLFRDKGTDLYGYRANYFYTVPASKRFAVRLGVEANYLTFKERNREGYIDSYYENDFTAKATFELVFSRSN